MDDLISRQAAIALADSLKDDLPDDERIADAVMARNEGILEYQTKLSLLPSAQPEQRWIPFHVRPLTEEEAKEHPEWSYYLDCELPEPEQDVLVSSPIFGIYVDKFYNEGSDGCGFDGGEEITNNMAWMPLPEPYQAERREE